MTLHAGGRSSPCLYTNKHASFPTVHMSASSRRRVYCFFLILAVGYDIPYPHFVEGVNSTGVDARRAGLPRPSGSAALFSIEVSVTSPATPLPLLSRLEQRADLVVDQLGNVLLRHHLRDYA